MKSNYLLALAVLAPTCLCMSSFLMAQDASTSSVLESISDNIEINGRIMLDYEDFDGLHNNNLDAEEFSIRRASLRVKYKYNDVFSAKIRVGYGEQDEKIEIEDVEFIAKLSEHIQLSGGKFKEPVGLEYSSSSRDLLLLERTMMTDAFVPRRNIGVQLSSKSRFDNGGQYLALGVFDNDGDSVFDQYAVSGRYTVYLNNKNKVWPSFFPKKSVVHLGVSGTWREENPDDSIRINQSVELYSGDSIVESTKIDADEQRVIGIEAGLSVGPFNLQAEYMTQSITANEASNDIDSHYSGHYVQVGYFLTGETLRYDDNRFEGVRPRSAKNVWMLVVRYSELDARDNLLGSEAKNISVGLNYYHNKHIKIMINASRAELSGRNAIFGDEGNALTLRAQYRF